MDFYKEKSYHTSDNADYVANEWDKGHMAPAAAFGCDINLLKQTFTYLNSALQHQSLNRGPWKELEESERVMRQKADDIQVYIRVDFKPPLKKVSGGATIPSGNSSVLLGAITAASSTSNSFNSGEIYFPNYAGSTNKVLSSTQVQETNSATNNDIIGLAGLVSTTSAINRIDLTTQTGNFVSGSRFDLYGIKSSS